MSAGLSELGRHVRVQDPDRFYAALFARPDRREALFALLAFNHEIARVREQVSEVRLGEIRLAWWHEALDDIEQGRVRAHPAAKALAAAYRTSPFDLQHLHRLIDARGFDLANDPMESLAALETYAKATGGALHRAMAEALQAGGEGALAAEMAGTAFALAGILRALPVTAGRGQSFLPADRLALHHVPSGWMQQQAPGEGLAAVISEVGALADQFRNRAHLMRAGSALPAVLPIALVPAYLHRISRAGRDPLRARTNMPVPEKLARLILASLTLR